MYTGICHMLGSNAFCPIVWYTDRSWARCVSPHIRFCHWYKNRCINETKTSTCRERQSWCSLLLRFSSHFFAMFLYHMSKMWRDVNVWRRIPPCLDLYITQWDKIHYSKTWARAVSFHPVPRAMARVVFLSTKKTWWEISVKYHI